MTINAYLKFVAKKKKVKIKDLAIQTSLDAGYLSRFFNNKIHIEKERNIVKLCNALNVKYPLVYDVDEEFEFFFQKYLTSVYFLEREKRLSLYQKLCMLSSKVEGKIQYLDFLLAEFIQLQLSKKTDDRLFSILKSIYKSFSSQRKSLFLIFCFGYFRLTEQFEKGLNIQQELKMLEFQDENMEMMYHYYRFSFGIYETNNMEYIYSYEKCKQICEKTQNNSRLINLNIGYALHLSDSGYVQGALDINLNTLRYLDERNINYNKNIVIYNIADCYLLLRDYDKASHYYLKTLQYEEDDSIYFYLALCFYRLGEIKKAKDMVKKGKISKIRQEYYMYLLNWLEYMMKEKYSKKCIDVLEQLWNKYEAQLVQQQKSFILVEMLNYYHFHEMHTEAYRITVELINSHVVSHTLLEI